jgi:hypothetical protein
LRPQKREDDKSFQFCVIYLVCKGMIEFDTVTIHF